jgi:hypothetical protein
MICHDNGKFNNLRSEDFLEGEKKGHATLQGDQTRLAPMQMVYEGQRVGSTMLYVT